jgi:hypothetical protein
MLPGESIATECFFHKHTSDIKLIFNVGQRAASEKAATTKKEKYLHISWYN